MTQDDIIRMADKAGLEVCRGDGWPDTRLIPKLMRFAALVAAAAALAQPEPEPVAADPTDPGYDVNVLREQVRHLERRIRQLAQPALEPVQHAHQWVRTGGMEPGHMRCIHCGMWAAYCLRQRP